jgi:hypothetical protein
VFLGLSDGEVDAFMEKFPGGEAVSLFRQKYFINFILTVFCASYHTAFFPPIIMVVDDRGHYDTVSVHLV